MSTTMKIQFDTSAFKFEHGHTPRGLGSWAFVFGKTDYVTVDEAWFVPGPARTYTEAKRLAVAEASRRGVTLVGVCP
jgi:hypothetical protein